MNKVNERGAREWEKRNVNNLEQCKKRKITKWPQSFDLFRCRNLFSAHDVAFFPRLFQCLDCLSDIFYFLFHSIGRWMFVITLKTSITHFNKMTSNLNAFFVDSERINQSQWPWKYSSTRNKEMLYLMTIEMYERKMILVSSMIVQFRLDFNDRHLVSRSVIVSSWTDLFFLFSFFAVVLLLRNAHLNGNNVTDTLARSAVVQTKKKCQINWNDSLMKSEMSERKNLMK